MPEHRGSISHLHALHQVTGSISLYGFGEKLTAERLEEWASALDDTARLMREDAAAMRPRKKSTVKSTEKKHKMSTVKRSKRS